jgi:hypothetical protein
LFKRAEFLHCRRVLFTALLLLCCELHMTAMMLQALALMADARPTFPTALAIADGGSAVAEALRAHGVVRVTRALSKSAAAALMEAVDLSLADALQATEGNEIDSEQWQSRFGDIMSPRNRHDVKLSLEAPPVRARRTLAAGGRRGERRRGRPLRRVTTTRTTGYVAVSSGPLPKASTRRCLR